MSKFSNRLAELRHEKGLSQKEIAKLLYIPQTTYSHYEVGNREPSIETIIKLCDLFDVSADYLLGRKDDY